MRYLLPLVVCAALGAIVIVVWKMGDDDGSVVGKGDREAVEKKAPEKIHGPLGPGRNTPTSLEDNKWLSELERAMSRKDLSRALYFRQKVCEDIDKILADEKLRKNLLALIRANGPDSDDPRRRDVVLPMLRVIQDKEATAMIANEYYRARDELEQMTLLEAMSHKYHDPKQAAVWAVERALNSDSKEHRERAFLVIRDNSEDIPLVLDTAFQILESTTRRDQAYEVINEITRHGREHKRVREFVRGKLKNPRADELMQVVNQIEAWGTERDAAQLETLAEEFPAMGDMLRDVARRVREGRRAEEDGKNVQDVPDPGAVEDG